MKKRATRFLLLCLLACPSLAGLCQITLRGVIVDDKKDPVAAASVTEKGTTNGTTSDASGTFLLNVRSNAVLVITNVGFQTKEVSVGNATSLTIPLASATTELGGVVVTALGISK